MGHDDVDTSEQPQRAVKKSRWLSLRRTLAYITEVREVSVGFALAVLRRACASGEVRSRGYNQSRYMTIDVLPYYWQQYSINISSNCLVSPDGFVRITSVRISEADLAWWLTHRYGLHVRIPQPHALTKIDSDRASENVSAAAALAVGTARASGVRTNKSVRAEDACREWISNLSERPASKEIAFAAAAAAVNYVGMLTRKAFDRAWANSARPEWKLAGRRRALGTGISKLMK
jgi:hypothetical protein